MIGFIKSLFRPTHDLSDIFTPASAARLTFIKRSQLEADFTKNLVIPGKQIVLYGNSGGGKSTLIINKLNELKKNYITTSCIRGTTVDSLILATFDKLNPYYTSEKQAKSTRKITSELKASYRGVESALKGELGEERSEKQVRLLPVQLSPQRLAEFLGAANCIWIIEDFHKVEDAQKSSLAQIMKVFVDVSNTYQAVKIIAIGALDTAREVVTYEEELTNRVAEILVPLLNEQELREIITSGCDLLNVTVKPYLIESVIKYSNNLGAVCHQLCFNLFYSRNIYKTTRKQYEFDESHLQTAIKSYVKDNSDSFKALLDNALKQRKGRFQNVRVILEALIKVDKEQATYNEILTKIREVEPDYPQSNLTVYLKPLTTPESGEIVRYDENASKYSFANPFFKAFTMMVFEDEPREKKKFTIPVDVDKMLERAAEIVRGLTI